MTIPLDIGINTWLGSTFALAAKDRLKEMECGESVLASKPYLGGLTFTTVFMGLAAIAYKVAPDWELMYYADHEKLPKPIEVAMFGLFPALYTLGFLFTRELQKKKDRLGWAVWAGNFVGELGYIAASANRLLKVGTMAEYERGEGQSIFKTPLMLMFIVMPAVLPALKYFTKKAAE